MDRVSGDAQRFEVLYRTHYAAIVRFVHRRADAASAEEVIAETFAVAWRRFVDVPAEPLPWLYVVARNVLRAQRRATSRNREGTAELAALAMGNSRDPADVLAERDRVLRAFTTLSEPDREALRLVAWEGLDHRDGAVIVGTTRVGFTMRVSRARRRLEAALAEIDDPRSTTAPDPEVGERRT